MSFSEFKHIRPGIVVLIAILLVLSIPNTGTSGGPIPGWITITADPRLGYFSNQRSYSDKFGLKILCADHVKINWAFPDRTDKIIGSG